MMGPVWACEAHKSGDKKKMFDLYGRLTQTGPASVGMKYNETRARLAVRRSMNDGKDIVGQKEQSAH